MTTARAKDIATKVVATGTNDEQYLLWADNMDEGEDVTRKQFLIEARDGDGRFDLDDWVAGMTEVEQATEDEDWDDDSLDLIIEQAREILTEMIERA